MRPSPIVPLLLGLAATVAHSYRPGTTVNLEADVIARYVHRVLVARKQSE